MAACVQSRCYYATDPHSRGLPGAIFRWLPILTTLLPTGSPKLLRCPQLSLSSHYFSSVITILSHMILASLHCLVSAALTFSPHCPRLPALSPSPLFSLPHSPTTLPVVLPVLLAMLHPQCVCVTGFCYNFPVVSFGEYQVVLS